MEKIKKTLINFWYSVFGLCSLLILGGLISLCVIYWDSFWLLGGLKIFFFSATGIILLGILGLIGYSVFLMIKEKSKN